MKRSLMDEAYASLHNFLAPAHGCPGLVRNHCARTATADWQLTTPARARTRCGLFTQRCRPHAANGSGRARSGQLGWSRNGLGHSQALIFRAAAGAASPAALESAVVLLGLPCFTYPGLSRCFLPHLTIAPPRRLYKGRLPTIFSRISVPTLLSSRKDRLRGCVSRAVSREIRLFLTAATAQPAPGPKKSLPEECRGKFPSQTPPLRQCLQDVPESPVTL